MKMPSAIISGFEITISSYAGHADQTQGARITDIIDDEDEYFFDLLLGEFTLGESAAFIWISMPRIEVSRSARIAAPAKLLWGTIGDFGSITSYFPSVVRCTLEGSGVGARRHLVTDIGGRTTSELIELDDARMIMAYRVLASTVSIENYTSRMLVRPLDDHHCEVSYTSCFEPRDTQNGAEIRSFIEAQLDSALQGLRRLHENPTQSDTHPSLSAI